jgi:hypothetical protein
MGEQADNPTSTSQLDRLVLATLLVLLAIASIFTIWIFLPREEWIWIGVTRSNSYDLIEREFIAAKIHFGPEGSLGWDHISVRPEHLPRARALLAKIRKEHPEDDPVVWIEGIDPPWLEHLDHLRQSTNAAASENP